MDEAVARIAAELRGIALEHHDAGGFFPAVYSRETSAIAELTWDDDGSAARARALVQAFAGGYIEAWRREVPRPRCWKATWDVAGDGSLLITQHLLLGINAHVNFDLPLALAATAADVGGMDAVRPIFDAVESTFAGVYAEVLRDLDGVSRWVSEASFLGGGRLFNFSLDRARRQAWQAAEQLSVLDGAARDAYVQELDELVAVLAYLITRPPLPVRPVQALARLLEEHDPAKVTRALLGDT